MLVDPVSLLGLSDLCLHAGDNLIVGSREGKLCWFDMDLSSKPYRVLKYVITLQKLNI